MSGRAARSRVSSVSGGLDVSRVFWVSAVSRVSRVFRAPTVWSASRAPSILKWMGGDFGFRASQANRIGSRSCTTFPFAACELLRFVGCVAAVLFHQQQAVSLLDLRNPQLSTSTFPYTNGQIISQGTQRLGNPLVSRNASNLQHRFFDSVPQTLA